MRKDLRIALAVTSWPVGRIGDNLERTAHWTAQAAKGGASLICFPEMNLTGYANRTGMKQTAQCIPGPASNRISDLAVSEGITILAGMAEVDAEGRYFVSHLSAGPDGSLRIYRKTHIAPPERQVFSRGSQAPLFEAAGARYGIQLCYDAHFPELSTRMALQGADILFFPHASPRGTPEEKLHSWLRHLTARAFDNGLFVAAVNQTGTNGMGLDFPGVAVVIGPDGNIIDRHTTDREELVFSDLSADQLNRVRRHPMRYFLPNRRPDLYGHAGCNPTGQSHMDGSTTTAAEPKGHGVSDGGGDTV
jgi:N-carbamoylputrescine amidase